MTDLPGDARLDLGPSSVPKSSPTSTREVSPAETERRVLPLLPRVPISRVADLTGLDPLGFPVFVATTPHALDLTTHAGKGSDALSARVSAIMEAIERVSAEETPPVATLRDSYRRLIHRGQPAVEPLLFDLASDSSYHPDTEYSWVVSHELFSGRQCLLASDLALNPAREGILQEVDTNGLASGNTLLEAVLHGLCEVIERDALSQLEFTTLFGDASEVRPAVRSVDPRTLPREAASWLPQIESQGLTLVVQDLATDLGVPTMRSVLVDPGYPTPNGPAPCYFPGFGTHPNRDIALQRSLGEALQSRVGFVHGGRDSFNGSTMGDRRSALRTQHEVLFRSPRVPYGDLPTMASLDLRADLRFLLDRLEQAGLRQVIVTELGRRDWNVPVVRVRVPGLACFLVNRRRVGSRCLRHLVV